MSSNLSNQLHGNILNYESLDISAAIEEENVDALVSLGLTARQTRVYLAVLLIGNAKAKKIAAVSLVSRQDIYVIISDLQEIGLIQRKVTSPTIFTATPLCEALETLLQRKSNELKLVRAKTKNLVEKFSQIPAQADILGGDSCLGVISEGDSGKKYRYALGNAANTIEIVTTWKRFKQVIILFEDELLSALKRGVIIRIVAEKPQSDSLPNSTIKALTKNPNFNLRTVPYSPSVVTTIFDNAQVALPFNNTTNMTSGLHLWSNSPNMIALSQAYFNSLWKQLRKNQK